MNRSSATQKQLTSPRNGAFLRRLGTCRRLSALALALLLIAVLAACQAAPGQTQETAPPDAAAAPASTPAPSVQETAAAVAETEASVETQELPEAFFDDALFIGDSLTGSLRSYLMQNGGLGTAKLVSVNGIACHNIVLKDQKLVFMGKACSPAEAASLAGAKKMYLLLAANDVGTRTIEELRACWDTMISEIRELNPEIKIYVQSGTPFRGDVNYFTKENMDEYNEMLRAMCEESGCVYVDIAHFFKDEFNALADVYCSDQYVHITNEAAALWASLLRDPYRYSVNPLEATEQANP